MNVLITNIGRRGYLVRYLKQITEFGGKIYVSDCDDTASGLYGVNDGHFILPRPVDDEELYVHSLLKLCLRQEITVVIPVIDPEIYILSNYVEKFKQRGITIMVSSKNVLDICYNKIRMNHFLDQIGFLIPKTYTSLDEFVEGYEKKKIDFPVIVKPVYGSGSVSTFQVTSMRELVEVFSEEALIQEFIDGQEYGVDVFNDLTGKPLRCVVKKKLAMRSGETDKAQTVKDECIQKKMVALAQALGHIGNLDCDVIKQGERLYVIDLNPRFGGGYPATHESGVNLLAIILQLVQGKKVEADFENYIEGLLVMKEVSIVTKKGGLDG